MLRPLVLPSAPDPGANALLGDQRLHPAMLGLSDAEKIRCYQLALDSCLHALRCLPGDEVIKALIRRDLYAQIERDPAAEPDQVPAYVRAAIKLFT